MQERSVSVQGETELSFRLIPSLTEYHTKPRTETVREEVILSKEGISLKDNSVSYCICISILIYIIISHRPKFKQQRENQIMFVYT